MFTIKQHVCEKCGHIYQPLNSPAFVKTSISPCPNCGSGTIAVVDSVKQAQKKSNKIKGMVKGVKKGIVIEKVKGVVV